MKTRINFSKMKVAGIALFFVCFGLVCKAQDYSCGYQMEACTCSLCTTVYTPKNSPVCLDRTEETIDDPEWIQRKKDEKAGQYYPVEVLDVIEAYSCHGFAWIMSDPLNMSESNGEIYFIKKGHIDWACVFWADGSYVETMENRAEKLISAVEYTRAGVLYMDATHSAIKTSAGKIMEKLGASVQCPLLRYDPKDIALVHQGGWSAWGTIKYFRKCDNVTYFTNQTVTSDTTITDCNIYVKDVKVQNNAKLILDATFDTTIDGELEIEIGSELEIKVHTIFGTTP